MNLFYLRYFVTLAHTQHYTKTAEQLYISQPGLSYAIAQLEKELGLPLFEKSGQKTTLTQFGKEFLSYAEHALSILDTGIASLKRSAGGEGLIRLGLLRTLGIEYIPRLAAAFLKENPDANIQFTFHTGTTQVLLEGLAAKKYDLIFCSQPPAHLNLTAASIQKQDLVLIVPNHHPLSAQHTIDLPETLPYPQILLEKSTGMRSLVDQMFSEIGEKPQIAYETEEDQVIAGLVAQGFGIAVVPYMDLLLKLDLKILQINAPSHEYNFYLVSDDSHFMSPAVHHFQQFVLDHKNFYSEALI
ncbi:MAG: LysR family transcriptional regulator [Eubacterium sp.]|nr:LysR family transcriptional regulator [Eubacterium sp.]